MTFFNTVAAKHTLFLARPHNNNSDNIFYHGQNCLNRAGLGQHFPTDKESWPKIPKQKYEENAVGWQQDGSMMAAGGQLGGSKIAP